MSEVMERDSQVSEKPPKTYGPIQKTRITTTINEIMTQEIDEILQNLGISDSDFERIRNIPGVESNLESIHSCLKRLYPYNPGVVERWMVSENLDFNDESPVQYIIDHDTYGLAKVTDYVYQASLI